MHVEESQVTFKQIRPFDLDEYDESLLMQRMSMKVDMDESVNAAIPIEIASEVYAVSVIAINDVNEVKEIT